MDRTIHPDLSLDVRGYLCPIPALKSQQAIIQLAPGGHLGIVGDDPVMLIDIPAWCDNDGHRLIFCDRRGDEIHCLVQKGLTTDPRQP